MNKLSLSVWALAGCLAISSCKKEDEETTPTPNPTPTPTTGSCSNIVDDSWCINDTYYTLSIADSYTTMNFDATSLSPSMTNLEIDFTDADSAVSVGTYPFFYQNGTEDVPAGMMRLNVYIGGSTMYAHKNNSGVITVTESSGKRYVNFSNEYFYNVLNAADSLKASGRVRVR